MSDELEYIARNSKGRIYKSLTIAEGCSSVYGDGTTRRSKSQCKRFQSATSHVVQNNEIFCLRHTSNLHH